jgi:hypothetical protein
LLEISKENEQNAQTQAGEVVKIDGEIVNKRVRISRIKIELFNGNSSTFSPDPNST